MAGASSSSSPAPCSGKQWPPGFRFRPTDQELVGFYLARKLSGRCIQANIIAEVDLYKCEPWDLPGKSCVTDVEWYFFSPRDKKYPNGWRANRATEAGYWKATGKDRAVRSASREIGMKKTLVFYRGRAPHGERTDWIMHEYRADEDDKCVEPFVVCRVFRKSTAKTEEEAVPCYPEGDAFFSLDSDTVEIEVTGPVETVETGEGKEDARADKEATIATKAVVDENDELDAFLAMLLDEPVPDLAQVMDNPGGELAYADPEGTGTEEHDDLMKVLSDGDFIELGDLLNPAAAEEEAVDGGECIVDASKHWVSNSREAAGDEHSMFIMDDPYLLLPPGEVVTNGYHVGEGTAGGEGGGLASDEGGDEGGALQRILLNLTGSVRVLPASAAEFPGTKGNRKQLVVEGTSSFLTPAPVSVRVTVKMISGRSRYGGNLLFVFLLGSLTALFWMFVLPGMSKLVGYMDPWLLLPP